MPPNGFTCEERLPCPHLVAVHSSELPVCAAADWRVREAAVAVLGGLGSHAAPQAAMMAKLMEDADWRVRVAAATALGELGAHAALHIAVNPLPTRFTTVLALGFPGRRLMSVACVGHCGAAAGQLRRCTDSGGGCNCPAGSTPRSGRPGSDRRPAGAATADTAICCTPKIGRR